MFEHLINDTTEPKVIDDPKGNFVTARKATPEQIVEGQSNTAEWLDSVGAATDVAVTEQAQDTQAREAFHSLSTNVETAKVSLTKLTTPPAVQKLVGMLTAYDWSFVEQAKELRGMTVAKILEETDHPDARIRLKALELLGRVTEVGLFTDRVEIKKAEISDTELDKKIKEKLNTLEAVMPKPVVKDVTDVKSNAKPKRKRRK